jgi:hypothetical protein
MASALPDLLKRCLMPFADELSLLRVGELEGEADVVRSEWARKNAHDTCWDPVRRCAGRGLGVPGDADDVADPWGIAQPVCATAAFRDVDADCVHAAVTREDPDQQRRVLHTNARRSTRGSGPPFVRRGEFAAHARLVDAGRLGDPLPGLGSVEPAQERFFGHRCFVLEAKNEAAVVSALDGGAHARPREPIDDLHRIKFGRPSRRAGIRAHAVSYRLRQGGGLPLISGLGTHGGKPSDLSRPASCRNCGFPQGWDRRGHL